MGWIYFQDTGYGVLMGARNLRPSLIPLHTELEVLIWVMHYMISQQKTIVSFATNCVELVKMVEHPSDWPSFDVYLEELEKSKGFFLTLYLSYIPRLGNAKADLLACSARRHPHDVFFVDTKFPVWASELV